MYENTRKQLGGSGSAERSDLFKQLTPLEQKQVTGFLAWFRRQDVEKSSVSSYKSYVCHGILKDDGRETGDLSKSEKSGMKKFFHWLDTVAGPEFQPETEDETDDVTVD